MSGEASYVTTHTISVSSNTITWQKPGVLIQPSPLLSGAGNLVGNDPENTKGLKPLLTSVCPQKTGLRGPEASETTAKIWIKEYLPFVEEDQAKEHFTKLGICKSTGPDRWYPQELRELADTTARPRPITFKNSQLLERFMKTGTEHPSCFQEGHEGRPRELQAWPVSPQSLGMSWSN